MKCRGPASGPPPTNVEGYLDKERNLALKVVENQPETTRCGRPNEWYESALTLRKSPPHSSAETYKK